MAITSTLLLFGNVLGQLVGAGVTVNGQPELVLPNGHTDRIECIAINSEGSRLVTGARDHNAIVWDVNTGKKTLTLIGHHDKIKSVEFSKNDKLILTAGWDGAFIWDAGSGQPLRHISTKMWLDYARFNFDATKVLTGSGHSGDLELWSVVDTTFVLRLPDTTTKYSGYYDGLCDAAFSPDGNYIAAAYGSGDPLVRIWDSDSGKLLFLLNNSTAASRVEFSSNSKYLITGAGKIWDVAKGTLIREVKGYCTFNADGSKVLSVSRGSAELSEVINGNVLFVMNSSLDANDILKTNFSSDGRAIVVLSEKGEEIWSATDGTLLSAFKSFYPHPELVVSYSIPSAYSSDCRIFSQLNRVADGVQIWDVFTGRFLREIKGQDATRECVVAPSGLQLLVVDNDDSAAIYDLRTAGFNKLNFTDQVRKWEFSPDSKMLVGMHHAKFAGYNDEVRVWDGVSGKMVTTLSTDLIPRNFSFSDDSRYLCVTYYHSVWIWNTTSWSVENKIEINDEEREFAHSAFEADGKTMLIISNERNGRDGRIEQWDWKAGKKKSEINAHVTAIEGADMSKDGRTIVSYGRGYEVILWDAQTGRIIRRLTEDIYTSYKASAEFSPGGKFVIVHDRTGERVDTLRIFDVESGKEVVKSPAFFYRDEGFGYYLEDYKFNFTESEIWFDYGNDTVVVVSTANGQKQTDFAFKGRVLHSDWIDNTITTFNNGEYLTYDLLNETEKFRLVVMENGNYVWLLPSGEYLCSPDAARSLSWKHNSRIFEFDQWDVQYNRPDKVLAAIGNQDTTLISLYRNAYLKRLRNLNIDTLMFSQDYHVPEISLLNSAAITGVTTQRELVLDLNAKETDSRTWISRIIVTVNGVPVYGTSGLDVSDLRMKSVSVKVPLVLSEGDNVIKISCINNRAAESLRRTLYTTYAPLVKTKHKRYYIGIGVSDYKDSTNNLFYAVKDATDLSTAFLSNDKDTEVYLLLNDSVTRENIVKLKKNVLSHTNVDDEIILSFSGHGITNALGQFYFGTWDIDFLKPERRGISFTEIEWLLDSIPARKKLVLMDACHSGAIDKDVYNGLNNFNEHHRDSNIRAVGLRGVQVDDTPAYTSSHSFELMQSIFSNMTRSNGATFISASAGTEFAFEGRDWKNGVFTYSVLSGLKEGYADLNNDGSVHVNELKTSVGNKVLLLTNGLQRPVTRSENPDCDWVVWLRK